MAKHLTRTDRRRRWAVLLVALGVGLVAFLLAGGDDGSDPAQQAAPGTSRRETSTSPTVLGAVVTPSSSPAADPAAPVDVSLGVTSSSAVARPRSTNSGPGTTRPVRSSTTTTPSTSASTTTTEPGTTTEPPPTLIPPTSIDNTTTTTEGTTTTEPSSTSTTTKP